MKVSIIIPYNINRGYLEQAIESVKNQTYKNIELLIEAGDCSVGVNLNRGIKKSTGDLIRYVSEDDLLPPNSIKDTVEFFNKNKNIDFIQSNALTFFEDKRETILWEPPHTIPTLEQMLNKYLIHGGTVVYKKKCFDNYMFDESLWTGEEYDFNLWLLKNKYKIGYLNSITYKYRRHIKQKSIPLGIKDVEYQKKRTIEKEKIKRRYT